MTRSIKTSICLEPKTKSVATVIRLETKLSKRLETVSQNLHRDKNSLIIEAVRMYLEQLEYPNIVEEARKQSLLANKQENPDADLWEINSDHAGWNY
ncbi:MAG: ribbon-helix-helix domain-containing protein [Rickettsia endosymbiont of Pseudomimeciton antennatum]|nr:ribbon-helix-helix domain-containing protein [Rickettsia endosymbiont of Pseudomimeciton antennatum]MCC8398600.1 ribbon-helix-helix domain-containing protein [Rickettsia endosymbiont of Labidopullus appendiculatus]